MCDKYRETKQNWQKNNRERINQKRRELRARKKAKKMEGKFCLLCEIRMIGNSNQTSLYCKDCNERYADKVRRHRWRRYYYKKTSVQRAMRAFNPEIELD